MFGYKNLSKFAIAGSLAFAPAAQAAFADEPAAPVISRIEKAFPQAAMDACIAAFDAKGPPNNPEGHVIYDQRRASFGGIDCFRVAGLGGQDDKSTECVFMNDTAPELFSTDRPGLLARGAIVIGNSNQPDYMGLADIMWTNGKSSLYGSSVDNSRANFGYNPTEGVALYFTAKDLDKMIPSSVVTVGDINPKLYLNKPVTDYPGPNRTEFNMLENTMRNAVRACGPGIS